MAALHADYSLLGPTTLYPGLSTPAKPGEPVSLYGVGFGLPTAALSNGSSSQSGALAALPVCSIGSNTAPVSFAGLISPGLYQINMTIPNGTTDADQSVSCTYNGASTPATDKITVHQWQAHAAGRAGVHEPAALNCALPATANPARRQIRGRFALNRRKPLSSITARRECWPVPPCHPRSAKCGTPTRLWPI